MKTDVQAIPTAKEVRKTIFTLIWPVTVENVLQMLIGFVNMGIVGRLGAATILAVGLSSKVNMFPWLLFGGVGTGVTVLVARAMGAGEQGGAKVVVKQGLLLGTISALLTFFLVYAFAPQWLAAFKITEEAYPFGVAYSRILAFSMPFQGLVMVSSAVLRGRGDTRTPMGIALVVNTVGAVLSYFLTFGVGSFAGLGFRGPALGTTVGQATGAFLALRYLFSFRSGLDLVGEKNWPWHLPTVKRIGALGLPNMLEMLAWQLAGVMLFRVVNDFGTEAGAAYQIGMQAEAISYMPAIGFGIAATTLVARSLGARNPELAERYMKTILLWGALFTTFASLLLMLFPKALMSLFTTDAGVVAIGANYLFIMAFSQMPAQLSSAQGGCLRGAGDAVTPMVAAIIGTWIFRVPLSLWLSRIYGLPGVWWAVNIDQLSRLLIVGFQYLRGKWKRAVVTDSSEPGLSLS